MASNFWVDVLRWVVPAGLVIGGLTALSIIGVGTFGNVRSVKLAATKDTKFYFMADVINVLICAIGSILIFIFACICFKLSFNKLRHHLTHSHDPSIA